MPPDQPAPGNWDALESDTKVATVASGALFMVGVIWQYKVDYRPDGAPLGLYEVLGLLGAATIWAIWVAGRLARKLR